MEKVLIMLCLSPSHFAGWVLPQIIVAELIYLYVQYFLVILSLNTYQSIRVEGMVGS